jgi:hypothetical protein
MTVISHQHRFIFIKTAKTAGTSVQMALEQICGENDICAPVTRKKQARVNEEGYRARNFRGLFFPRVIRGEGLPSRFPKEVKELFRRQKYRSHMIAADIRSRVGSRIWNDYKKFTIERNPWDKVVSDYFWARRHPENQIPFETWVREGRWTGSHFHFYTINGEIAVDQFLRYESLAEDFDKLLRGFGLSHPPSLPVAKTGFRTKKAHYRDVHTDYTREATAKEFSREIEYFGYHF